MLVLLSVSIAMFNYHYITFLLIKTQHVKRKQAQRFVSRARSQKPSGVSLIFLFEQNATWRIGHKMALLGPKGSVFLRVTVFWWLKENNQQANHNLWGPREKRGKKPSDYSVPCTKLMILCWEKPVGLGNKRRKKTPGATKSRQVSWTSS